MIIIDLKYIIRVVRISSYHEFYFDLFYFLEFFGNNLLLLLEINLYFQ